MKDKSAHTVLSVISLIQHASVTQKTVKKRRRETLNKDFRN